MRNPLAAHPPWRQLIIISVVLPLAIVLAVLAFAWPAARIAPRNLPVGIVGTASASEVLTGALQDWDRATIIGRRTFGKGLVQEQYQLSDGSALRLTILLNQLFAHSVQPQSHLVKTLRQQHFDGHPTGCGCIPQQKINILKLIATRDNARKLLQRKAISFSTSNSPVPGAPLPHGAMHGTITSQRRPCQKLSTSHFTSWVRTDRNRSGYAARTAMRTSLPILSSTARPL